MQRWRTLTCALAPSGSGRQLRQVAPRFPMPAAVVAPHSASKTALRVFGWGGVVALGTVSIAVLAWSRGEPVNALWMIVAALCVFAVAYRFHSAWLMAKVFTLDEQRATPAEQHADGKDF